MALATLSDVESRLQTDIDPSLEDEVADLLAAAQAHIEAEVGREVESDTRSETLDSPAFGGTQTILLKWWPVTNVASVTEDGAALTAGDDYKFYGDGRLIRVSGDYQIPWRTSKVQSITTEYTGGFAAATHDVELAHLGSLCTEVVARAFRQGLAASEQPAGVGLGGIQTIDLHGSDTVTYHTVGGETIELGGGLSRFVFLLDSERRQLFRYKTPPVA